MARSCNREHWKYWSASSSAWAWRRSSGVASLNRVGGEHGSYEITAKFDTIGSLAPGSSVKIAGVKIGRVKHIGIDSTTFQAVATLEIAGNYANIPDDSVAKILTAGLLGEQYVGIDPGGEEQPLKNGDEIKFTQSAFVLENMIGQFLTSMAQKDNNQGSKNQGSQQQPAAPTAAPSK